MPEKIVNSMPSDIFLDGEIWYSIVVLFLRRTKTQTNIKKVWEGWISGGYESGISSESGSD